MEGEYSDREDRTAFAEETAGRKLLVVGPGKNISLQKNKVRKFINDNDPYVIAINYIPDGCRVDCVFVTNSRRYHDMTLALKNGCKDMKFLATTNVECRNGAFDYVVQRAPLLETAESIIDNSFLMLLKFLKSIDKKEVYCAGFDGYSDKEDNYCNPAMEYFFVKQEAAHLNMHMKEAIAGFRETMKIEFITYSAYDEVEDINRASI
jgi:4-hydroxy 2-oxovalerate aldolase